MGLLALGTVVLATAAMAATSANAAGKSGFSKTQNAKIYCIWSTAAPIDLVGFVECRRPGEAVTIKAGKTWRGGGMSCTATTSSFTCKNKVRHGFTITTPGPYKQF